MNKNSDTLLVIMPVYNSEKTLSMAIESILQQTYKNIQLVIVDDASTDGSLAIIEQYAEDPRVFVVKNRKNMGAYYSRNVGLYMFRSKEWAYFTTHDSDDISFRNRYSQIINLLKKNEKAVGVQDKFERIDFYTKKSIRFHVTFAHAVFTREVFTKLGYFDSSTRFAADWEHWERVNLFAEFNNKECLTLDSLLGKSFVHENNLTVKIPGRSLARKKYVIRAKQQLRAMSKINKWYREFKFLKAVYSPWK